ncbi:tetratricopeptide repeat protein [Streptomyces sp. DSM 110735]|nr:tetratricopeptide repeat protein [Streptomyces sp. DSM 110735]
MGGIGKTELAIQVAHSVRAKSGWFPGGVLFIDLFGYDDQRYIAPDRALTSLLHALGVPEEQIPVHLQDRSRLYRSILATYARDGARILVVVDNAASADQVKPLLPSDGVNAALVTSRHLLSIGARVHQVEVLDSDSAIELLRRVLLIGLGEDDHRIDAEIGGGHELARLCGYLPLALQICAAVLIDTPRRPISSLAASLKAAQSRIDRLHREGDAVRPVFDLSYARLSGEEKKLLGFISFSPGTDVSTTAAARLIDSPEDATEELLISLSRAHLVEQGTVWGRWRLHDLVRLYALEAVEEFPGQEEALVRLLEYYIDHAREASAVLLGNISGDLYLNRESALEWFDSERHNLVASVHIGAKQDGLVGYAAEMSHRLAPYFDARRFFNDWKEVMEVFLTSLTSAEFTELRARTLDSLGMACRELYQWDASLAFHREARELARSTDRTDMLAPFLNNLGNALYAVSEFDAALGAHSEAAGLFLDHADNLGFARSTDNAASALRELGRPEDAIVLHEAAIEKFREGGATESEARTLTHMGCTLQELGRLDEAIAAHRQASELLKDNHLLNVAGYALINLSHTLRENGDLDGALASCNEALELHAATDDSVGRARACNQLGLICTDLGEVDQAISHFEESLDLLANFNGLADVGRALANLGRAYGISGQIEEAINCLKEAAAIFAKYNARSDLLMAQQLVSVLLIVDDDS